jgi:hypothetical protein
MSSLSTSPTSLCISLFPQLVNIIDRSLLSLPLSWLALHLTTRARAKPVNYMASSHSSRSSTTPATNATARSPTVPVDGDHSDRGAQKKERAELRRGPWTVDEDLALVNYITDHGEGRWNTLAPAAGTLALLSLLFACFSYVL